MVFLQLENIQYCAEVRDHPSFVKITLGTSHSFIQEILLRRLYMHEEGEGQRKMSEKTGVSKTGENRTPNAH